MKKPKFFAHSSAIVETNKIGSGTRIWGFSHVQAGVRIGRNCNVGEQVYIESGAIIGNECTIKNGISVWDKVILEDGVFLGPGAVLTNDIFPRAQWKKDRKDFLTTRIRRGATVGAGAVILCGIQIGEYALVAAGAVVTRSVPKYGLVRGNPARLTHYVCECGRVKISADQPRWSSKKGIRISCKRCGLDKTV